MAAAVLCIGATANAEMRIWTSKKGKSVEAEYVKMYGSKVVLKTIEGKTLHVPVFGLCDDDQEYLARVATVPPKIVVSVAEDMERDKNSSGYPETLVEWLTLDINVRKRNPEPCVERFKTELYILGREKKNNEYFSIIDIVKRDLTFAQSDLVTFTEKFTIKSEVSYSWSSGFEYQGYLFCVKNSEGEVVAMDCNQNILERNLGVVLKSRKNDVYNEDFIKID
jgi:hypothetical protein